MEDSSRFMQWAMDTLLHEHPEPAAGDDDCGEAACFPSLQALRDASHAAEMVRELMMAAETHDVANGWTSSGGDGEVADVIDPAPPAAATDYHGSWPQSPNSFPRVPAPPSSNSNTSLPAVSWNFVTGSAHPGSDGGVLEEAAAPRSLPPELAHPSPPPPTRRTKTNPKAASPASCTPDHIVAERKRREKINKRLIELSSVIPGLKKMDKATILSDAAKYVKELQQRLRVLEEAAAAGNGAAIRSKAPPPPDENGSLSPTTASKRAALPEIEARFSENSAMVRICCSGGKGVAATALAEVEGLGLAIGHANVMPFSACTMIITITAEMMDGLTVTTEQIIGRLKSALSHQGSSCNDTEDTEI